MDKEKVLAAVQRYIKNKFEGEGSGHDWWHIYRVLKSSEQIAEHEDVDLFTVQLGALLHDIADWKFVNGDEEVGPRKATELMESLEVDALYISKVCDIIREISFKGAGVKTPMSTKEGEVVQDADRLDAIGAIGIARTFAYGGNRNREIYNPDLAPEEHNSFEAYKKNEGHTINHFYEKLLLLKDRMNTSYGKKLAQERHEYMEGFLSRFYSEWEGKL